MHKLKIKLNLIQFEFLISKSEMDWIWKDEKINIYIVIINLVGEKLKEFYSRIFKKRKI